MNLLNNKITLLFVAGLLTLTTACDKEFLEKNPLDSVSSQIFWKTEGDAVTALAGVYSKLQENFLGYERVYLEGLSDNAFLDPGGNQGGITNMATGSISPNTGGAMANMYSTPYRVISSANYFLKHIDKAPLPEDVNSKYKAEVMFIRALAYFDLVRTFGAVPLYEEFPETWEEAKIAKSSKEDLYELIEKDLDFAIGTLPEETYRGHAVKGSAQALKARVLITQNKWEEALPLLEEVINSGVFQLSNNYAALFTTAGQENPAVNREIIFATQYLAPNNVHHDRIGGMDIEFGWWTMIQPYEDLAEEYEMEDGLPAGESPLFDPEDPFENRDPRLDMTMKLPGEVWLDKGGNEVAEDYPTQTGFRMEKYLNLSNLPFTNETTNTSDQDYIHIRYADVLLMYAEAKNEIEGPGPTVYDALNKVRSRPGVEMPDVNENRYNSKESLREFIHHERRIELALEGQRYNDLKRWRLAHVKLPTMVNAVETPLIFTNQHYTWPIPQAELDNNPQLEQNDDYL